MSESTPADILREQRRFFHSGETLDISFRIRQLKVLKAAIVQNEKPILDALMSDMSRPALEGYVADIGTVVNEIDCAIRNVKKWTRPRKTRTPIVHFLASSWIYSDPFGVALIIGTWNYPFQLTLNPLIGAMAAGNCAVVKPSEIAPHSSRVIAGMIEDNFHPDFVTVVEGGDKAARALLSEPFDYIFFTGSTRVGRIVLEAAAKNFTPVTLELGGKCPCIVDREAHIEHTARRIAWGKYFNTGQTCIAPDYLLVDKAVKRELLEGIEKSVGDFYGDDPSESRDFGRIINEEHFERLSRLIVDGDVITGGQVDAAARYIAPTVIDNVSLEHKIMEEEVFGPILPVIEYEDLAQAISIVTAQPKPLALYFFSQNRQKQERVFEPNVVRRRLYQRYPDAQFDAHPALRWGRRERDRELSRKGELRHVLTQEEHTEEIFALRYRVAISTLQGQAEAHQETLVAAHRAEVLQDLAAGQSRPVKIPLRMPNTFPGSMAFLVSRRTRMAFSVWI